jgi:O-antigen ligase
MFINKKRLTFSIHPYFAAVLVLPVFLGFGYLIARDPIYLAAVFVFTVGLYCLCNFFESTVLGLLVIRSSLDVFSTQGIPGVFALGLIALTFSYLGIKLLMREAIQLDRFFWFLAAWIAIKSIWVVLLPLGGLGLGGAFLGSALREWLRLFSVVVTYLLVLQLRGKIHPHKLVSILLLSLILPLSMAVLQISLPESALPSFLSLTESHSELVSASRINGTFGHPNSFVTYLVLFTGLAQWKLECSKRRWPWILLVGLLVFFIVSTKALVGLLMTIVLVFFMNMQKMSFQKLLGAAFLSCLAIFLFASSEFGQERLVSLYDTPLLNPDIDTSRAIIMRNYTINSFLWRIAQWTSIIEAWKEYPILGFGLGAPHHISFFKSAAHNDYVRALAEGGIVGLAIFLLFMLTSFLRPIFIRLSLPGQSAQGNLCIVVSSMFLAMMVGMATENVFSHTALLFYLASLSSVVAWDWSEISP